MLVFKPILDSGLTDKQILFQLARINSWISLNGKIANSYKSKINIDFRGLTSSTMKKLGYEPNTIVKNTIETDASIFQAENKCDVKYPYVPAEDEFLLDTNLNPAQKVLLLILREVWLDKNGKQLLPYCQTETIFKHIPTYNHTRDYTNKLISQLQEKGYISFDTVKNRGRVNVRIDFKGNLKNVKEELSNQKEAEEEITEMIQPVNTNEVAILKEQVSKLQEEVNTNKQEIAMLKDIVSKLQEKIDGRKTNDIHSVRERTDGEGRNCVRQSISEDTEITEGSETVEQSERSSNERTEKFGGSSKRPESDGWISLRNDADFNEPISGTGTESDEQIDEMDSFLALIPEGGEYSQKEIEAVKAENPVRLQRKAEITSDSLFHLANDIDFKAIVKDVQDDIKAEKEYRSNSWKSSKKDEFQEYIKQLQKEAKKDEIVEYIINTVNEANSRMLINSLDNIYYKLVIKVITKNRERITNTYFKNVGEFDIHHSTLEEFTSEEAS